MTLAYIGNRLDRSANLRTDAQWLEGQRRSPAAKLVRIAGDQVEMRDGLLLTEPCVTESLTVFLGIDEGGAPWFACKTDASVGLAPLRGLAMENALPPNEIGILAQARSLIAWHERRTFCSNCAARNEVADAGYRRHCPSCGMDHFPRTDPVAIIVVRHQGRILLGRQSSWTPGMYSALAGFMEPGETIEDAARREVFEEAGVKVGEVRYVTSQPWPFPSNIMIGLIGEALDATITLDTKELEEARWFPHAEAKLMLERKHPDGLWATNPFAIAHHLVGAAIQAP